MSKWIYYNHALKPDLAPSETVDEADINKAGFWKMRGGGYFFICFLGNRF